MGLGHVGVRGGSQGPGSAKECPPENLKILDSKAEGGGRADSLYNSQPFLPVPEGAILVTPSGQKKDKL